MPRKAILGRPMSTAERQARHKARLLGQLEELRVAMRRIQQVRTAREARALAASALAAVPTQAAEPPPFSNGTPKGNRTMSAFTDHTDRAVAHALVELRKHGFPVVRDGDDLVCGPIRIGIYAYDGIFARGKDDGDKRRYWMCLAPEYDRCHWIVCVSHWDDGEVNYHDTIPGVWIGDPKMSTEIKGGGRNGKFHLMWHKVTDYYRGFNALKNVPALRQTAAVAA